MGPTAELARTGEAADVGLHPDTKATDDFLKNMVTANDTARTPSQGIQPNMRWRLEL